MTIAPTIVVTMFHDAGLIASTLPHKSKTESLPSGPLNGISHGSVLSVGFIYSYVKHEFVADVTKENQKGNVSC